MLSGPAGNATQIGSHDPDASQAPASSSTICSATTGTCVDVPGGTADVNTNAVGAA